MTPNCDRDAKIAWHNLILRVGPSCLTFLTHMKSPHDAQPTGQPRLCDGTPSVRAAIVLAQAKGAHVPNVDAGILALPNPRSRTGSGRELPRTDGHGSGHVKKQPNYTPCPTKAWPERKPQGNLPHLITMNHDRAKKKKETNHEQNLLYQDFS